MARVINCKLCGNVVVTHGSRTLYCPACSDTVSRERKKQYALKRRMEAAWKAETESRVPEYHSCDSPERIALCLNCTRPRCVGTCDDLRTLRKKE